MSVDYRVRFYELIAHFADIGYPDPVRSALVLFRHNGRMSATVRRGRAIKILVPKALP